jgi:EAL domain-containing protein (putative c-di-GMP-specific phosphodiesterase class I)
MLDTDGTEIPPGAFIPAAERYNLMGRIDRWVIAHALRMLREHGLENGGARLAINLSGLSLTDDTLPAYLRGQLHVHRVLPGSLCFEVTETAAISHLATAVRFIEEMRTLGCRFALDDFGSGMSSFAYLKNLPVDFLKIDGAFVRDIETDPIDHAFVETIQRIGQAMGKQTIAEFVENETILRMLDDLGVNFAQGYGVSRPRPLEDWLAELAADAPKARATSGARES